MSQSGTDTLVRMINQIAANVSYQPADQAATQIATHINAFWAPSMRADLLAYVSAGGEGLDPVARDAVAELGFN